MGLLSGKVALVTGAGGGLGRAYALLLAREGARVVVNDLGTDRHGEGEAAGRPADRVVGEIVEAGGEAVANYDSVADAEGAERMVEAAWEAFGGLDVVINNAGILRDKTLVKMEDSMWDAVMAVHLTGTFLVSRAAVRRMLKAGVKGRIINTSSYAGLKGNFGQTNYGAAKAGIAGFTRSLALETRRGGITVNAIAPIAKTRMTEDIDLVPDQYGPEDIAPLVVWLVSDEAADVTGRVFGAHGAHYFEYVVETTPGVERAEAWEVSEVGARFGEITARASAGGEEGGGEARALIEALPGVFDSEKGAKWKATIAFEIGGAGTYGVKVEGGAATFVDGPPEGASGKVEFDGAQTLLDLATGKLNPQKAFMSGKISTNNMDVLMKVAQFFDLEAAGRAVMGEGGDAVEAAPSGDDDREGPNRSALGKVFKPSARFVEPEMIVAYAEAVDDRQEGYLNAEVAPPLFAVQPMFDSLLAAMKDEELDADLLRLVHGEQEMIFHDVLRPWDLLTPRSEIASIEEKSSGWLIDVHQRLFRDGELVVEAHSGLFVRRAGGSKGSKGSKGAPEEPVRGELVAEETQVVADDQPRRYAEASGDHNPIHLDKSVAEAAGLPNVILHGLCTMAFAARAVVNGPLEGRVEDLGRIAVRFARPVLPGAELTTRVWATDEEGAFEFETVDEAGRSVLTRGEARKR